jgi:hypothetical protein
VMMMMMMIILIDECETNVGEEGGDVIGEY